MLAVPLRLVWSEGGASEECEAQTTSVNRHGAWVRVSRPLPNGAVVRLINIRSTRAAEFRVIGLVAPLTGEGGVYGMLGPLTDTSLRKGTYDLESMKAGEEFWGIHFPPPDPETIAESTATIECRSCHTLVRVRLSLVEADVLETAGMLSLPCDGCHRMTPWGYAKRESAASDARPEPDAEQIMSWRRHRRVSLTLPVLIRRYSSGTEVTHTDDVSKGGFAFTSEKDYYVGEGLMVACPYSEAGPNIEVPAQIVRQEPIAGTRRQSYGVCYAGQEAPGSRY